MSVRFDGKYFWLPARASYLRWSKFPGAKKVGGQYRVLVTPHISLEFRKHCRRSDFSFKAQAIRALDEMNATFKRDMRFLSLMRHYRNRAQTRLPYTDWSWELKTTPYKHQVVAMNIGVMLQDAGLFMGTGTGKTLCTIGILGHFFNEGQCDRVLIIAPKPCLPVWPKEFLKHAAYKWQCVQYKRGRLPDLEAFRDDRLQVFVVNYESCWRPKVRDWILEFDPDRIVLDEGHRVNKHNGRAAKQSIRFADRAAGRTTLTGTPWNKPWDVFGQFRFLQPRVFGERYADFKYLFCKLGGPPEGNQWIKGLKDETEFKRRVNSLTYSVTLDDVDDTPDYIFLDRYCELGTKGRKHYREMKEEFETMVDDELIIVDQKIAQISKMHQLTGGHVFDARRTAHVVDGTKHKLALDILAGHSDEKCVVFARFIPEIDRLKCDLLKAGRRVHVMTGQVTNKEAVRQGFQKSETSDIILVQVQSGIGIDLDAARVGMFYSFPLGLIQYQQCLGRLKRITQKSRSLLMYRLIAEDTYDEVIVDALATGHNVLEYILKERDR